MARDTQGALLCSAGAALGDGLPSLKGAAVSECLESLGDFESGMQCIQEWERHHKVALTRKRINVYWRTSLQSRNMGSYGHRD